MQTLTRRRFVGVSLAALGCLPAAVAGGQTFGPSSGSPQAPRPSSEPSPQPGGASLLPPGTRLVWAGGSATIPGSYSQIVPGHDGQWVDRNTGQHYSESHIPGAAGVGFLVGDVAAAGSDGMLIQSTALLADPNLTGATSITAVSGMMAGRQAASDLWVAPSELAALPERNDPTFRVLRTSLTIGGRQYRAIRIQSGSSNGWVQNTFDLDTGVALSIGSTVQGSPIMRLDPGNRAEAGRGSTQIVRVQFAGSRRTHLPGPGAVYPPTVRALRSMTYAASTRTEMASVPPMPATPLGQVQYQITANRGAYLEAAIRTQAATENGIFIAGVVGSPWMDPGVLARYGAGQVIDRDQLTGLQISAAGRQGEFAVMVAQTRLTTNSFGYDLRNGLLAHVLSRAQVGPATVIHELRLVDAR